MPDLVISDVKLRKAILGCHATELCLGGPESADVVAISLSQVIRMFVRTYRDVVLSQKAADILRSQADII